MNSPSLPAVERLDVQAFINAQPLSPYQWRIVLLCFLIVFLDGLDTAAMGFIAPALTQDWGIDRASLGPVMSAALIGMVFGALGSGPLADRYGRKLVLVAAVFLFGLQSVSAYVWFAVAGVGMFWPVAPLVTDSVTVLNVNADTAAAAIAVLLLAGYGYAHALDRLPVRRQAAVHLGLLAGAGSVNLALLRLRTSEGLISVQNGADIYMARRIENGLARAAQDLSGMTLEIQRSLDYFESQLGKGYISRLLLLPMKQNGEATFQALSTGLAVNLQRLDLRELFAGQTEADLPEATQAFCIGAVGAALRQEVQ